MKRLFWVAGAIALLATIITARHLLTGRVRERVNPVAAQQRESITFIAGEDTSSENNFYLRTEDYYRHNPTGSTTRLITYCRSLFEIIRYLQQNPPDNRLPWGLINIVVHGNEWTGLRIPVMPGDKRASEEIIIEAVASGKIQPLPAGIVDSKTEIRLLGCGFGRSQKLLAAVSGAFGATDAQKPIVRSSRYFLFYETGWTEGKTGCQQYLSDSWYAFYRTGYRPGDIRLAGQLSQRYPDEKIDWRDALTRKQPRWLGDVFHRTFELPVEWTVIYQDRNARPDLTSDESRQIWLQEQIELQEYLQNLRIPMGYFRWKFEDIEYAYPDGKKEAAIKATGWCTILCVLQVLTEPDPADPGKKVALSPPVTDTNYYTTVMP